MLKFKHLGVFLIFSILLKLNSFAFSEPKITCIQVQANGSLLISYKEPIDKTQGLVSYQIYFSLTGPITNAGTGTFLTSIPAFPAPSTLSFLDITNNGNFGKVYYRIDAVNAGKTVVKSSECISSLFISIAQSPLKITWDKPSPNIFNVTSSGFKYEIARYINGNPVDTFQTKPESFNDFTPNCLPVTYRVELKTVYGCSFISNKPVEVFTSELPDDVLVDSVSFDDNNNLVVTWLNIKTNDVIIENYLLYYPNANSGGGFSILNHPPSLPNVFNMTLSTLVGTADDPAKKQLLFAISNSNCASFGPAAAPPNVRFSPIFLDTIKDPCTKSFKVGIYGGTELERGVVYYKTFLKTNSGDYKFLDSIPAGSGRSNVYNYVLDSLSEGNSYKFFVRAYNQYGNATSTSMRYSFSPRFLNTTEPNKFHLKSVSTNSLDEQNIAHFVYKGAFFGSNTRIFNRFELIRSDCGNVANYSDSNADIRNSEANEEVVASTNFILGQQDYFLKDLSPKIFTKSYCYYIKAINTCNLEGGRTETHRNMVLEVKAGKDVFHQNLFWNNYEGFQKGVSAYKIYRVVDFKVATSPYRTVTPASNGSLNFFEDDIRALTKKDGRVLYYIKAIEASGNLFGSDSSSCNIDTANT
jgi:hypothetical protein